MTSSAVSKMLDSIDDDIDAYFAAASQANQDAVYFLESVYTRIMSTVFTREEKVEFMAIAASRFHQKAIQMYRARQPQTWYQKLCYVFSKEAPWL